MTEPAELLRALGARDRFMQVLGMELVDAGPGRAPRPCLRFAPIGPGGPVCPMKWVNIKNGWYQAPPPGAAEAA